MDLIIDKTYKITQKLGNGSFGDIYHATNLKDNSEVAVKLEPLSSKQPQLEFEASLYQYLYKKNSTIYKGLPHVYQFTKEGEYNAMVLEMLGPSLEDLFEQCNRRFSLKTILMIADQMLERIEFLHSRKFIHRDIKPTNFLVGLGRNQHMIYLIDLGLAKRFMINNVHIPYEENKELMGTTRYVSINTHLGIEQGRRDDLESICYVLVYFFRGSLPWQNIKTGCQEEKDERIMQKKLNIAPEVLCKGMPEEFVTLLMYCRNLKFDDEPDYAYMRNLLKELFIKNGYEMDYHYDWDVKSIKNDRLNSSLLELLKIEEEYSKSKEEKSIDKDKEKELIIKGSLDNTPNSTNSMNSMKGMKGFE